MHLCVVERNGAASSSELSSTRSPPNLNKHESIPFLLGQVKLPPSDLNHQDKHIMPDYAALPSCFLS
jgi:hypothetical protein